MEKPLKLYFLCSQNRCRSKIAEGLAKKYAAKDVMIDSAGLNPSEAIHPLTLEVLKEEGIIVDEQTPKKIDMKIFMNATVIIKLCREADERCPIVPFGIRNEQWNIKDPLDSENPTINDVRDALEQIRGKVIELLDQYGALAIKDQS